MSRLIPAVAELIRTTGYIDLAPVLEAAAADLRAQIARDIEALIPDPHGHGSSVEYCPDCWVVREAARIARGES